MEEIEAKDNVALVEPPLNTTLDQTMNRMLESNLSKKVQGWMTGKEDNIDPGNANSLGLTCLYNINYIIQV